MLVLFDIVPSSKLPIKVEQKHISLMSKMVHPQCCYPIRDKSVDTRLLRYQRICTYVKYIYIEEKVDLIASWKVGLQEPHVCT